MRRAPAPAFEHPRYAAGIELGRGAQGVVVRVVDREAPARALVAKVWRGGAFAEEALLGEFALLARARIPGLVRAHDLGRCARTGAPFLIEDFVDGPDASDWVHGGEPTARGARLGRVLGEVAATLSLLHESGFVHGDLKPAHVRVAGGDRPVLLDLGAAVGRARGPESIAALTPAFAAPEVRAGSPPSARSDLFSLGALGWAAATGKPPPEGAAARLGELAPWVPPSTAAVIARLLAEHPADRPEDARAALGLFGEATRAAGIAAGHPPAPIGRDLPLHALLAPGAPPVRYLVGPSGAGKSHLARELVTRALLAGRSARLLRFPAEAGPLAQRLGAFLRGSDLALPFAAEGTLLLVLDDLHLAPAELVAALDAHRCRGAARGLEIVATARSAPDGAEALALGPLDEQGFAALSAALGIDDPARVEEARTASGGLPGWLVASVGCVPLTRDTALERARSLSAPARELLGAIAVAGGEASEGLVARLGGSSASTAAALGELHAASLVTRRADPGAIRHALAAPPLARDLASALGSAALVDRVAAALLDDPDAPVQALLAAAGSGESELRPARRAELHDRAAARARAEGLRSQEIEALSALSADAAERTPARLVRLERLVRDGGTAAMHPEVLGWLEEAAAREPAILPLSLRRRAERRARDGDAEGAKALAAESIAAARGARDPVAEALGLGTAGLVALFRASYGEAAVALGDARARLAALEDRVHDPEEIARVDHNLGVVALYQGKVDEATQAFERSLGYKRALGDRAGMRSCLLNLGLSLAKAGRLAEADRALDESLKLARSLGQTAGRGWGLAARADVAVRRRDARAAAGWIAEAETIASALPAAVRADLSILRAEVALLDGDGDRAIAAVGELDPELRRSDPLIDARALSLESGAHLCTLPVDARRAARLALAAIRCARRAGLPEAEAQAVASLRAARRRAGERYAPPMSAPPAPRTPSPEADAPLWTWLGALAAGASSDTAALALGRLLVRAEGAERAFVAAAAESGEIVSAWGVDLDGLPLAEAGARLDPELVSAALGREGPVYRRDTATLGGRGSRLAVAAPSPTSASPRALVVLEHRFVPFAFDRVTAADAIRWATLAALALRAGSASAPASLPEPAARGLAGARPGDHTTAFPVLEARRSFPAILGQSPALRRALGRLDAAIDGELPVLIIGETGAGKELFARALHELGRRAARPLVAVNCGAIPDALFEAELFGHARGSFTGADRARPGLLARAEKGTLFLDEIGELPLLRQAGLLRALESRRYRPVGSDEEIPFDVRVVAATNRDLEEAVAAREFRQDLYYRLNAVEIRVPALRERPGDVPDLCRAFLGRAGAGDDVSLSREALAALVAYAWPGNVRELEHLMARLAGLGVSRIGLEHLPRRLRAGGSTAEEPREAPLAKERAVAKEAAPDDPRAEVTRALADHAGNISHAAASLGLTRQGLKKRMVRLGMRAAKVEKAS